MILNLEIEEPQRESVKDGLTRVLDRHLPHILRQNHCHSTASHYFDTSI